MHILDIYRLAVSAVSVGSRESHRGNIEFESSPAMPNRRFGLTVPLPDSGTQH